MASSLTWGCDHGAATGSPPKGTTRSTGLTTNYWKSVDDEATSYTTAKVVAGTNSFDRFLFGIIGGTFTQLSNGLFAHTGGALKTGLTLKGKTGLAYTTPSASTNALLTVDMTAVISITAGEAVLFSTTGPEAASPTTTLAAAGYTTFLPTQMLVDIATAAGANGSVTLAVQYDEV